MNQEAKTIKAALDQYYVVVNTDSSGGKNRPNLMNKLQQQSEVAYSIVSNARRILTERSYWPKDLQAKSQKLHSLHGSGRYEQWRLQFVNQNEEGVTMGIFHAMYDAPILPEFPEDVG